MTDWYEDYLDAWEALVNLVTALTETDSSRVFEKDRVFWNEKFEPDKFPSCYVCPMPITVTPSTLQKSYHYYTFEIAVVVENTDPKEGYKEMFRLLGKIYDALVADRHLGERVCATEPQQFIPNWRGLGSGIEQHWGAVRVMLTKYRA